MKKSTTAEIFVLLDKIDSELLCGHPNAEAIRMEFIEVLEGFLAKCRLKNPSAQQPNYGVHQPYSGMREARKHKNLTQDALSIQTGIDQSRLSRAETGHQRLTAEELQRVAEALGVPTELLEGAPKPELPRGAAIIREVRRHKNLTQDDLAQRTGIERSRICRAERGYCNFTTQELRRIARVLNIDIKRLGL